MPTSKEGFQTYKILNTNYTKEVFLVGVPTDTYSTAYTYDEADAKCKSLGATLATLDQMTTAQMLGAQWCSAGGWVANIRNFLYFPAQDTCTRGTCINDTSGNSCVQRINPVGGKGYANCYGSKALASARQDGDTSTTELFGRTFRGIGSGFGIQWFNPTTGSVLESPLIGQVISGDGKGPLPADTTTPDLFIQEITADQALYALERGAAPTSALVDNGPPAAAANTTNNWRVARQFIIDNWTRINDWIRKTDTTTPFEGEKNNEDLTKWAAGKLKSCQVLDGLQQTLIDQHKKLKEMYAYLQRLTSSTQGAKTESMNFQREIAYFCRGTTSAASPACKRLAELDYEVLYKSIGDNSLFKNLDNLNGMLAMRECEMQRGLTALQKLMDTLKCGDSPINLPFNTAALGNFKREDKTYFDCVNNDSTDKAYTGQFPGLMQVETAIGYIPSEDLKKALEEISPFFSEPGYADVFKNLLDQLSVLLRIPELNDYATAKQNLETNIPKRMESISAAIRGLWSS